MADFFDKVKQNINKGITTASVKSKEMLEVTRLNGQISTIQQQKNSAIEELGNIVYTMFLKNSFDEARQQEKCDSIQKLDNQIKKLEDEILDVQNKARQSLGGAIAISKCSCGADIFEDTKFCGSCGKKAEHKSGSENTPVSLSACSQCGTEISSGSKFCSKCGAPA